ncbi:MAG: hypothetical protein J0M12_03040 [Deltaproteobacteria bacterium]|nr:hypothetical protein [Deltaproteobacteria bacterium]
MPAALEFREIASILLGALTGALIGFPWVTSVDVSVAGLIVVISAILGGVIGYRKRRSTLFFYVCLIAVVGLATLLSTRIMCCGEQPTLPQSSLP